MFQWTIEQSSIHKIYISKWDKPTTYSRIFLTILYLDPIIVVQLSSCDRTIADASPEKEQG